MSVHNELATALVQNEWQVNPDTLDEPGETSGIRRQNRSVEPGTGSLDRERFLVLADKTSNPHTASIEVESANVARRFGLLHASNERRFAAFNSLVGHVYPTTSIERAVTCSLWCNWLFFFDDIHDEDVSACSDLGRVRSQMENYLGLFLGVVAAPSPNPLERLTIEFRARAVELAGAAWMSRFCELIDGYLFRGVLPAVENWRTGRTPSLEEYLEQRDHDSAVLTTIDLIEIAQDIRIPDDVRSSPDMVRARRACTRTVGCFNDIVSYPKEVLRHKNPNNLVHVLMTERNLSVPEALLDATEIVNEAAYELFSVSHRILSQLPPGQHPVRTYLDGMRIWQRGNIEYSLDGGRYASRFSPLAELVNPAARY